MRREFVERLCIVRGGQVATNSTVCRAWIVVLGIVFAMMGDRALAGDLTVLGVSPASNLVTASVESPITVRFDRAVDRASVTHRSFHAFGRWSGAVRGGFSFSDGDTAVTLTPDLPFSAGEQVMVVLANTIRAADGSPMRSAGYSWIFWTRARPSRMDFEQVASMTTRTTPGQTSRAYGAIATDLDGDRWLDLTIINEDSADLRVFMNRADGSGLFHPFTQPTFPVGDRASPNEPTDFNFDGIADICVVNINPNTVSVLLGIGDGTFAPQQLIGVGNTPRGIAVLDADGDGDIDIVNTNSVTGNLSLLLNDGNGAFSGPTYFDGGATNEWALAAVDMTSDGILDLVAGSRAPQRILILRGNGDGTFTPITNVSAGGTVWMLVCGDVNGDGDADVCTANSSSNNGSILYGNGQGGLSAPVTRVRDPFPLATDLADLDGDGDLDWLLSSYSGDWAIFINDGAGNFAFLSEIDAPRAASCAIAFDADNDGDLDLALIDELEDVVILLHNVCYADCESSLSRPRTLDIFDFLCFGNAFAAGDSYACDCDMSTGQGVCDIFDFLCFGNEFEHGCE